MLEGCILPYPLPLTPLSAAATAMAHHALYHRRRLLVQLLVLVYL